MKKRHIKKRKIKNKNIKDKGKKEILVNAIIIILLFFIVLYCITIYTPYREITKLNTENIIIEGKNIDFSSLTLEQKIAQMIIVRGDEEDLKFNNLNVGGIFLDKQNTEEEYKNLIKEYQENSKVKLFVATDLEGAWTPFHNPKPEQIFPPFSDINTNYEAEDVGFKEGELLRKIGFNINFAPVAEYSDEAYGGRTFSGSEKEVTEKIASYINGLQKNVLGTCKHYPGKGMEENLHEVSYEQEISEEDLYLFDICIENNISSIMIGHQIIIGKINSKGKPSSVSKEVISTINDSVLIISDEVNMKGLSNFYEDKIDMYVDLINSGENVILDFELDSYELHELILKIKEEVEKGRIDEKNIDKSVKKILITKGYEIK